MEKVEPIFKLPGQAVEHATTVANRTGQPQSLVDGFSGILVCCESDRNQRRAIETVWPSRREADYQHVRRLVGAQA